MNNQKKEKPKKTNSSSFVLASEVLEERFVTRHWYLYGVL